MDEIITRADGINRAIPTQDELRKSLRWLQQRELVRRKGTQYGLTDTGVALRRRQRGSFFKIWDAITEQFRREDPNI